ncbi:MAG: hypothetical protein HKN87_09090 [Saprospiraceae bacterium]|nr:hypothetical protein [Saprospiraceae bacterium]
MRRRKFLHHSLLTCSVLAMDASTHLFEIYKKKYGWTRALAKSVKHPEIQFPPEKRIPLGWPAFPVSHRSEHTVLHFEKPTQTSSQAWLRLTAAIDFREEKKIDVLLPKSGEKIGQFNIRYAHPFQPFQVKVMKKHLRKIQKDGIELRQITGKKDAWFFGPTIDHKDSLGFHPHLLIGSNESALSTFKQNMYGLQVLSPFGWMGGCVLDALSEMEKTGDQKAAENLSRHLSHFLHEDYGVRYENPHTEPLDGRFNSIEDFLPFSAIIRKRPQHPSIERAMQFLLQYEQPDGLIISGNKMSTEGCYTVAYPLAVWAVYKHDAAIAQKSIRQISLRARYLMSDHGIHQQGTRDGSLAFKNWGRGIAWLMLGTAKVIRELKEGGFDHLPALVELTYILQRAAALVTHLQTSDGLWRSFIDRPEVAIDTSASAGIAAALAWGNYIGILEERYTDQAELTQQNLPRFLTADGLLTQVSQINRGGESLQASDYRVIAQFGMGLMAQLDAALNYLQN